MLLRLWILVVVLTLGAHAYKIGVFTPELAGSQVIFGQRVATILADAGHNVTFIRIQTIPLDIKSSKNQKYAEWIIDALSPDVDYDNFKHSHANLAFANTTMLSFFNDETRKIMDQVKHIMSFACEKIAQDKAFLDRLKAADFDVVFVSAHDLCPIGIQHYVRAKSWGILNSAALIEFIGVPMGVPFPASYAAPLSADAGDHLTFTDRMKSVVGHTITPFIYRYLASAEFDRVYRTHLDPNMPSFNDILKTASLVFVNSNELYDFPKPTLHKIVNIGGIGMKAADVKPLSEEIQKIVDEADSIVVFTFGSAANAPQMPAHWKPALMQAFAQFPKTHFFMRYPASDMDSYKPPNVHLFKWLPQSDLLQNSKTRAFITHGGYNGMQEAILAGRPLLVIPLFGDQFRNSRIAEKYGFGRVMLKTEVSESVIVDHIRHLLNDDSYLRAAQRLKAMVLKKPISPERQLVRWTEFLAEFHNLDNLKPAGVELDTITYYNVDVYALFSAVAFIIGALVFLILRLALRLLTRVLAYKCEMKPKNKAD